MVICFIIYYLYYLISLCSLTLIVQLEEGIVQMLTKTIKEDGLEICTDSMHKPRTIDEYVQACRNQI